VDDYDDEDEDAEDAAICFQFWRVKRVVIISLLWPIVCHWWSEMSEISCMVVNDVIKLFKNN
jgi:hypothetical protein